MTDNTDIHSKKEEYPETRSMQENLPLPEELAELRRLAALVPHLQEQAALVPILQERIVHLENARRVEILNKRTRFRSCANEFHSLKHLYSMQ